MRFLRVAWVVLAVVVLGLDAAGVPHVYARYENVCTRSVEVCAEDSLLTPEGAQELEELGLSRGFYAAYQGVGLETAFTLVCFAVAGVIFLRRSDDRMALFTSFVLLIFGGAGAAGTMRALAEAHPAFWFPVNLLDYVSQVCFGIFFYLFPDGRFVPRWTRFLAAASALLFVPDIFSRTRRWPSLPEPCSSPLWEAWCLPRSTATGGCPRRSSASRPSGLCSGSRRRWWGSRRWFLSGTSRQRSGAWDHLG